MPAPASDVVITDGVIRRRYGRSRPSLKLSSSAFLTFVNATGVLSVARLATTSICFNTTAVSASACAYAGTEAHTAIAVAPAERSTFFIAIFLYAGITRIRFKGYNLSLGLWARGHP